MKTKEEKLFWIVSVGVDIDVLNRDKENQMYQFTNYSFDNRTTLIEAPITNKKLDEVVKTLFDADVDIFNVEPSIIREGYKK